MQSRAKSWMRPIGSMRSLARGCWNPFTFNVALIKDGVTRIVNGLNE